MPAAVLAAIPSPDKSVWNLGPVPIRAYALCIIAGIVAAIWITERRWVARGGRRGTVSDVAVWAVVFGLVGGRLYHVATDWELYFGAGRDPVRALYIWEGGLGIWGAISLGGVGAWIGCRRRGIKLAPFADAAAPGIAVAQAIGRWGNWFNQELFGRPTDLPWGLRISPDQPNTVPGATTYHPTFLYESLWCLALAGVLVLVDRRFKLGRGQVFALYVMGYTAGRVWIEMIRIDSANTVFGLRLNVWTSIVVFAGALVYFLLHRGPRETEVEPAAPRTPSDSESADADERDDSPDADAADAALQPSVDADTAGAGRSPATPGADADSADAESAGVNSAGVESAEADGADADADRPDHPDRPAAGAVDAERDAESDDSAERAEQAARSSSRGEA